MNSNVIKFISNKQLPTVSMAEKHPVEFFSKILQGTMHIVNPNYLLAALDETRNIDHISTCPGYFLFIIRVKSQYYSFSFEISYELILLTNY